MPEAISILVGTEPRPVSSANPLPISGASFSAALAASLAEIGKVNWRHINILSGTLTRPANATPYSANDAISDNATAGSVTANIVALSDTNDDPVNLTTAHLRTSDTGFSGVSVRLHLFDSDPTLSSGVVGGDNAAWSNKQAGWVGSFSGAMTLFSDGCRGVLVPDVGNSIIASPGSGTKNLWWQLQTLAAATPSANSTTFAARFKGFQGRM